MRWRQFLNGWLSSPGLLWLSVGISDGRNFGSQMVWLSHVMEVYFISSLFSSLSASMLCRSAIFQYLRKSDRVLGMLLTFGRCFVKARSGVVGSVFVLPFIAAILSAGLRVRRRSV